MRPELELTMRYHEGRPYVGYLKLVREQKVQSRHQEELEPDLIVDFDRHGRPLGIEILFPQRATWTRLNRVLKKLGFKPLARRWARALRAA